MKAAVVLALLAAIYTLGVAAAADSFTLPVTYRDVNHFQDSAILKGPAHPDFNVVVRHFREFEPPAWLVLYMSWQKRSHSMLASLEVDIINLVVTFQGLCRRSSSATTGLVEYSLHPANGYPRIANKDCVSNNGQYFETWWSDAMVGGKQYSTEVSGSLTFSQDSNGVYTFSSDSFFPIDNKGYQQMDITGAASHNIFFTMHLKGFAAFDPSIRFSLWGSDNAWLFINGRLALDFGGLHTRGSAITFNPGNAAEYGLTQGEFFQVDLFYADQAGYDSKILFSSSAKLSETAGYPCVVPAAPAHTFCSCSPGDNVLAGLSCTFVCEPNYVIQGNAHMTCQKDGSWSPAPMACARK